MGAFAPEDADFHDITTSEDKRVRVQYPTLVEGVMNEVVRRLICFAVSGRAPREWTECPSTREGFGALSAHAWKYCTKYVDVYLNSFREKSVVTFGRVQRNHLGYVPGQTIRYRMERLLKAVTHVIEGMKLGIVTEESLPENMRRVFAVVRAPAPQNLCIIRHVYAPFECIIIRGTNAKDDPEDRARWCAGSLWHRIKSLDVHVGDASDISGVEACDAYDSDASYVIITQPGVFCEGTCLALMPSTDKEILKAQVGDTGMWFRAIRRSSALRVLDDEKENETEIDDVDVLVYTLQSVRCERHSTALTSVSDQNPSTRKVTPCAQTNTTKRRREK